MSTHTYQISYKPPVLRAIVISSLPYFSSADALHGQNHNRAEPQCSMLILLMHVQFTRNSSAHLIFKSSSISLHVRRPSQSRWLIVSYPILLMKSSPWKHKHQAKILIFSHTTLHFGIKVKINAVNSKCCMPLVEEMSLLLSIQKTQIIIFR